MNITLIKHNWKFVFFLFSPLLGLLLPLAVGFLTRPAGLSPLETEIWTFSPAKTKLLLPPFLTVQNLACPVRPGKSTVVPPVAFPPIPLAEVAPPTKPGPAKIEKKNGLSFILVDGSRRLAIIDGKVVKIGDHLKSHTVAAIENDRVLLKSGKELTWLNIK